MSGLASYDYARIDLTAAAELDARIADIDRLVTDIATLVKTTMDAWVGDDAERLVNEWRAKLRQLGDTRATLCANVTELREWAPHQQVA